MKQLALDPEQVSIGQVFKTLPAGDVKAAGEGVSELRIDFLV
jgi:putative component of toxin-antitoxin plasmid stabilization module